MEVKRLKKMANKNRLNLPIANKNKVEMFVILAFIVGLSCSTQRQYYLLFVVFWFLSSDKVQSWRERKMEGL